jgi:pilus assembly protein CpaB
MMRRRRTVIALVLAIACGGLAGFSALELMRAKPLPLAAEPRPTMQQVVVAARPLPIGSIVGENDVKLVSWPGDALPSGYASAKSDVIGRGTIASLETNEPLLSSRLADRGTGAGLPIVIPEGMRAVSVRVDDVIAVAGFVGPQTRVDVLLTIQPPGSGEYVTRIVLQNVQALAANQHIERAPNGEPRTVNVLTLLVTPEDAERLTIASTQGRIQFALRNMLDMKEERTSGARLRELLAGAPSPRTGGGVARSPSPAPTGVSPSRTVEVYKGGVRALITY